MLNKAGKGEAKEGRIFTLLQRKETKIFILLHN